MAILGLTILVALGWRTGFGARTDLLDFYAPDAYVARAESFIARGFLDAECRGSEPRLVPHLDRAPAADRAWYRESYLAADVARFNNDPRGFGWAFVIDADCRLRGVHPAVHALEMPFHSRVRWLGDILYRGRGADATLRSARRAITLRRPDAPGGAREGTTVPVGGGESPLGASSVLLHFPGGEAQPAARLFHVGEEVVALNRVNDDAPEEARLLGHRLPPGRYARLETGDWLSVESRSRYTRASETFVYLGGEAQSLASVVRRQNDRYDRRTDDAGLGQIPDPLRDAAGPYLGQVARTLDRVLALLPEEEARAMADGFDVELTLDREVQAAVSRDFRAFCSDTRRGRSELAGAPPFSAGVTVLDGLDGDILAVATYPHHEDLAGHDLPLRTRRRLLQNQNFVLHPIGSAGKPFLFAAALDAVPELAGLRIAGYAAERYHPELFHCAMPLGYQLLEGRWDEWIDLPQALEMSSNKYTIELVTLSLAADRARTLASTGVRGPGLEALIPRDPRVEWPKAGSTSGVMIAGQPMDYAPDLGNYFLDGGAVDDPELGAVTRCTTLDRLDLASFREPLGRLTGAMTYRGVDPNAATPDDPTRRELELGYLANRFDLEPWLPLVEHLTAGHGDDGLGLRVRTTFQEVAPERVDLALNQITSVRADYVSLLLGGGTSIWTNVQLAEAMARLVTGRAVETRLVEGVRPRVDGAEAPLDAAADAVPEEPPGARELAPELGVSDDARAPVLEGMERVVSGARGTATTLRDELASLKQEFPGDTIALYSKTGSPILERSVPAAAGRALEQLVVRGRLALRDGAPAVVLDDRVVPWAAPRSPGRDPYLRALRQGLGEVGYRSSAWVRGVIRRTADELAASLASAKGGAPSLESLPGPLRVVGGRLVVNRESGLFARQTETSMGGTFIFTLVRLPGSRPLPPTPEDLADPKAKVLSVAVHLEAGVGSEDAVAATEALWPTLVELLR